MARNPTHGSRATHPKPRGTNRSPIQGKGQGGRSLTSIVTPTPYLHRHPYARSAARGLLTTHPYKTTGALPQPTRWRTALQAGRSRIPFPIMSVKVFIDNPSCRTGPGVDSVSNINQYQKYFLRGKGGRWVGLTTVPLSYANCLEISEPQTPETHRACPRL